MYNTDYYCTALPGGYSRGKKGTCEGIDFVFNINVMVRLNKEYIKLQTNNNLN